MSLFVVLISAVPSGSDATFSEELREYLRRTSRYLEAEEQVFRSEEALLGQVAAWRKAGAMAMWLADPAGKAFSSEQFAAQIGRLRDSGVRRLVIGIGPADGWSEAARAQADLRFTLGPMTLPHQLARLVVAEQIYRAATILAGHPYHLGH